MDDTFAPPEEDRLSRFAAGVQEACWLGAACVIPLLLNPRAFDLGYQPFKYGVWIILSAVGLSAWLVRAVNLGFSERSFLRNPLLVTLGLMGFAGSISTWLSVNRASSVWGAPETFQGIVTFLSALAMAALVSCNLRTSEQLRRLASVMILGGFAAGLLAILQRAGFDPKGTQLLDGFRAHSTAGHAIYLAGYLLMTIPLTLWQLLETKRLTGIPRWAGMFAGTMALVVQVAGFVCAESRGPTMAIAAMLFAFVVFLAVHHRRNGWLCVICGLSVLGAVGLGVLISADLPKDFGSKVPILKRFVQSKAAGAGFDDYRAKTWEHMPGMMSGTPPLPTPSGGDDGLNGIRLVVGYGPETLQSVLPQVMSWGSRDKVENRFHNLLWDQLFFYGLPGLVGLLAVVILTFHSGFQVLGWIHGKRDSVVFASVISLCGATGAILAGVGINAGFLGMGTLCGIAIGTIAFAVVRATRTATGNDPLPAGTVPNGLLIALLAGLVGHLIDMAFVFHSAPTAVMFWLSVGIVNAVQRFPAATPSVAPSSLDEILSRPHATHSPRFTMSHAALLALGVVTLIFGFLHQYSLLPMTFGGIFEVSLFQPQTIDGQASLRLIVPVALLLIGGPMLAMTTAGNSAGGWAKRALKVTFLATLVGGTYCIVQILKIRAIGSIPDESAPLATAINQSVAYEQLFFTYLATVGLLLALAAWDLARPYPPKASTPFRGWLMAGISILASMSIGWQFALRPLQANLSSQWAAALIVLGRPGFAQEIYRRAIRSDPQPFAYRALLATSLMESADRTQDVDAAKTLLAEAEGLLLAGVAISEFNRLHFVLGQLYLQRALNEPRPARDLTTAQAVRAFAASTTFEPHQEECWTYASIADRLLRDDPVGADEKLNHALQLASKTPDVASATYAALGINTADARLRAEFARIAALHLDRLLATTDRQRGAKAKFEKAKLLLANQGDTGEAETLLREAVPEADSDTGWKAGGILAEVLMRRGDTQGAVVALKNSLQTAPENMRQPLTQMIIKLGGTP